MPLGQGASQAGDLGDRAGRERVEHEFGELAAFGQVRVPVGVAELLSGVPGDFDLDMLVAVRERDVEPGLLPVGGVFRLFAFERVAG